MTKTTGPSIYIPTDKNIFDALQHKKVTQSELVTFLRKRGILVSNSAQKQQLIEKISAMTLGYRDFEWLGRILENPNRKDKSTHATLKGEIEGKHVKSACEAVKANLAADGDDSVTVIKKGNKTTLKVTYVDHDFTKTEMRQRSVKTCEIEIEQSDNSVVMKMPSTKKGKEISEQLKGALRYQAKEESGKDLQEHSISLEAISDAKSRSEFFDILIRNIADFELDTVTSVDVFNFRFGGSDEFDEEDTEARLASYINKAALNGEGVLESKEFSQLHSQGFYIYRIVWLANEIGTEKPRVEFEVQFGDPATCTDFTYKVRGLYHYNSRTAQYNVTRTAATKLENDKYGIYLRNASELAHSKVLKTLGG
tara:strand:- start:267 stop:1367 length:1101 start_codon:yes stop_codon:yes gene_type:complete